MKKKSRRENAKFPNLQPHLNLKIRQEEIYVDYLSKLNDSEKAWLDKFNAEYVNASLDRKNIKNNLHNSRKWIKECTDRNNARNRDILAKSIAGGEVDIITERTVAYAMEDALIEKVDYLEDTSDKPRKSGTKGKK